MRSCVAVLLTALCLAPPAHAQARSAVAPADDVEAAKAHFAAGSAYYEQANYADAVKEFNEAYRLSRRSDLLYNIAVCYERLGQYDSAIKTLQQYLVDKPDAKDKVTIQTRISNLEKLRDTTPPPRPVETPAPAPSPSAIRPAPTVQPPPPPSIGRKKLWWLGGTIVGGAGVLLLASSLSTGLAADDHFKDLKTKCMSNVCPSSPTLSTERDTGQALALSSDILLGVGAAATLTGVILLIVQSRRPHAPQHALALPTPFGVIGRF